MKVDGKAKILEAAREVIVRNGANGATVRAIADEAGVTTGAIYHHYKNKEDLLYDLLDDSLSVSTQIVHSMASENIQADKVKADIVRETAARFKKDAENRLQYHFAHEVLLGNTEVQEKLKEKYREWTNRIEEILVNLYGLEETRLNHAVSAWLIGAVDGVVLQYLLDVNDCPVDEMMEVFELLLEEGLPAFIHQLNER